MMVASSDLLPAPSTARTCSQFTNRPGATANVTDPPAAEGVAVLLSAVASPLAAYSYFTTSVPPFAPTFTEEATPITASPSALSGNALEATVGIGGRVPSIWNSHHELHALTSVPSSDRTRHLPICPLLNAPDGIAF